MSVKIRTVRTLTNVVRVWFGCDDCGMYGSASVGKSWRPADYVDTLNREHRCGKPVQS